MRSRETDSTVMIPPNSRRLQTENGNSTDFKIPDLKLIDLCLDLKIPFLS